MSAAILSLRGARFGRARRRLRWLRHGRSRCHLPHQGRQVCHPPGTGAARPFRSARAPLTLRQDKALRTSFRPPCHHSTRARSAETRRQAGTDAQARRSCRGTPCCLRVSRVPRLSALRSPSVKFPIPTPDDASLAATQRLRPKVDYVTAHARPDTRNLAGALPQSTIGYEQNQPLLKWAYHLGSCPRSRHPGLVKSTGIDRTRGPVGAPKRHVLALARSRSRGAPPLPRANAPLHAVDSSAPRGRDPAPQLRPIRPTLVGGGAATTSHPPDPRFQPYPVVCYR